MTPPQLFLIKEQIIIPFGFPFALFGNWKKVILTEATVLIFWLYLIRQTVCPKKYTLEVSLDRCVWSVLISELYSLSPLSTNKIFYFSFALPIYISRIKWSNHILEFSITILQKYEYEPPLPKPFSAWMIHVRYVSILCAGFKSKKVTTNLMIFKKKFLGKWLEIPISHLFTVIIQKKNLGFCPPLFLAISLFPTPTKLFPFLVVLLPPHNYSCPFSLFLEDTQSTATTLIQWKTKRLIALEINITDMAQSTDEEEEEDRFLFSLFLPLTLYYSIPIPS